MTSWLDLFKKKVIDVSSEIQSLFNDTMKNLDATKLDDIFESDGGIDNFIQKNKIADKDFKVDILVR